MAVQASHHTRRIERPAHVRYAWDLGLPPTDATPSMRLLNKKTLRTLGGLLAAGIPVGYLIRTHIGWEKTPAGKLNMGIHQATFWTLAAGGMVRVHRTYRMPVGPVRKLFRYGSAGLLMAGGFWGGI